MGKLTNMRVHFFLKLTYIQIDFILDIWFLGFSLCICMHRNMHTIAFNLKRGHEFEREQGRVYGRVWKEERKEEGKDGRRKKTEGGKATYLDLGSKWEHVAWGGQQCIKEGISFQCQYSCCHPLATGPRSPRRGSPRQELQTT